MGSVGQTPYEVFNYKLLNKGIVARYATDELPPMTYLNLDGIESRQENSLSTRFGRKMINTTPGAGANNVFNTAGHVTPVHTLARLKSTGGNTYRYAGTSGFGTPVIYRKAGDAQGVFGGVGNPNPGFSGQRFSARVYRPSLSSKPYLYIADAQCMAKDDGTMVGGNRGVSGITAPFNPPQITIPAGVGNLNGIYDYRLTYYDSITGTESNPSQTIVPTALPSPVNQNLNVAIQATTGFGAPDKIRLYRRGGTLPTGWKFIVELPFAPTTYLDTFADAAIAGNPSLLFDNDAPVTTTLAAPLTGTLGTLVAAAPNALTGVTPTGGGLFYMGMQVTVGNPGSTSIETVNVFTSLQGIPTFTAAFQFPHAANEPIVATTRPHTPMDLMEIAFDQAWYAGDPVNPHYLYYSKKFNPESVPPQNFLEIGQPGDPIMAIIGFRGVLYVFTQQLIYQVNVFPGLTPVSYPTGVHHGLAAKFGWCLGDEEIWYQAFDGIRRFVGGRSPFASEPIDWIETGQNLGPIPAMDKSQISQTLMAYYHHEVFISYVDTNATRRRVIYSDLYQRWRNDSVPANAIFYEEDIDNLVIGDLSGFEYSDRTNDWDSGGYSAPNIEIKTPIAFVIQSPYLDQGKPKNEKVYNELTLDLDTQNQNVSVDLIFNMGATTQTVSTTINTQLAGRKKVQIPLNNGLGYTGYNVSIKIYGSATAVITFWQIDIKVAVQAEQRQSFDSYWLNYGIEEFKTAKQGHFEYVATDPAGITFNVFLDGSSTPSFSIVLPQSIVRVVRRKHFLAFKFRTIRFVATSPGDFQLYGRSVIEWKPVCGRKGYQPANLLT